MLTSTARFETENGSKYLQQLCKHFAHKVDVTYSPTQGECRFSCGSATLDADAQALVLRVEAADAEQVRETQHVIESHLARFAFRESMPALAWSA